MSAALPFGDPRADPYGGGQTAQQPPYGVGGGQQQQQPVPGAGHQGPPGLQLSIGAHLVQCVHCLNCCS